MNDEIWKNLPGYDGYYMVSNLGRIKSLPRVCQSGRLFKGRILSPCKTTHGYRHTTLRTPRTKWTPSIAKLIALAFLGPKPKGFHVCHNNGDKSDDRAENLRYDTPHGNNFDKLRHGTHQCGEKHGGHKLTDDQVRQIQSDRRLLKDIAKEYGITTPLVSYIQKGTAWRHIKTEHPVVTRTLSRNPKTGRLVSHVV